MLSQSDSDEDLHLSAGTFAALQEFYNEQEIREKKLNNIVSAPTTDDTVDFDENWVYFVFCFKLVFCLTIRFCFVSAIEPILV